MKLTYKDLNDQSLNMAMQKLGSTPLTPKVAYNISRIQNKLQSELVTLRELFTKLVKKYSELDEKGNVKQPGGPGSFQIKPDCMDAWNKEHAELMDIEFDLEPYRCKKIKISDITEVKLSPYEISALEPMLTELELLEDEKAPAAKPGLAPVPPA